jgi:hypothetical protein
VQEFLEVLPLGSITLHELIHWEGGNAVINFAVECKVLGTITSKMNNTGFKLIYWDP